MAEEKEFPLIVWENTAEYKQEYEQAGQRFDDIEKRLRARGFRCTMIGDLTINSDGVPEVWLNENRPLMADRACRKPEDAIECSLAHGDTGWWSLDDLEQFVQGRGFLFKSAMWDLGYRRSKVKPTKWARKNKGDKEPQRDAQRQVEATTGRELERLSKLWVMPNENAGLDNTFALSVGKKELIYIRLEFNPFYGGPAEGLSSYYGPRMRARGHIAKQQDGFYIEPREVLLGEQRGIYVRAVKPDASRVECVWPVRVPKIKLHDLAADLVSRVKSS